MLATLIKKEVLEHLMTLRFSLACILCITALCLGTYVNLQEYKKDLADYHTNVSMHRYEVEQFSQTWQVNWQGVKVDVPLNPMRIFAARGGGRGAQALVVDQNDEPHAVDAQRLNPVEWLFPRTDLTFFVGVLMSLLALVFSYDTVSGEKERGTLRLMLSYSVPRDTVLLGKWIGGFVALILPFTLALICSLLIVALSSDVNLNSTHWMQVAGMYGLSIIYLSAVYSLGVFISSRTSNGAASAVVALLVWVLLIPVLPNVSPYVAAEAVSSGSLAELGKQKREAITSAWTRFDETQKKYDKEHNIPERWWEQWDSEPVLKRRKAMLNEEVLRLKEITTEHEKLNNEFLNAIDRQTALSKNVSRVSFFSSFMYSLLAIGADDGTAERQTRRLLADYKSRLAEYGAKKQAEEIDAEVKKIENFKPNFADIPKFEHPPVAMTAVAGDIFIDVCLLLVWNIVFFMSAYVSFLRYDVR